jgi:hypothetical protein
MESYILFASFGLRFGINHNTPKGCLGNPVLFAFGLVAYGEMAKEGEISGTLIYILEDP